MDQAAAPQVHREPVAVDELSSLAGLRAIATFEAIKGIAVLVLMIVLFAVHSRADDIAESLLFHLHIDPDRRMSQAFLRAAENVTDMRLLTITAAALTYATVRFVESWGLWHRRVWAEWFALLSGAMYLPWEIIKLVERRSIIHILVFVINVIVVLYMLYVRIRACREPGRCAEPAVTT